MRRSRRLPQDVSEPLGTMQAINGINVELFLALRNTDELEVAARQAEESVWDALRGTLTRIPGGWSPTEVRHAEPKG